MESLGLFPSLLLLSLHGSCAFLQHLPGVLLYLGAPLQKHTPVPQGKELPPISHWVPVIHTLLDKDCRHSTEWDGKKAACKVHSHPANLPSSVKFQLQEFNHYLWYYIKIHIVGNEMDHHTKKKDKMFLRSQSPRAFLNMIAGLSTLLQWEWLQYQPYY